MKTIFEIPNDTSLTLKVENGGLIVDGKGADEDIAMMLTVAMEQCEELRNFMLPTIANYFYRNPKMYDVVKTSIVHVAKENENNVNKTKLN